MMTAMTSWETNVELYHALVAIGFNSDEVLGAVMEMTDAGMLEKFYYNPMPEVAFEHMRPLTQIVRYSPRCVPDSWDELAQAGYVIAERARARLTARTQWNARFAPKPGVR